jgi:hypothetical protein
MFGPDGMSIGLGIFLASLYLGTIYLYVQTRDQWNWSRMVARTAFLAAGALVGGALIYGGSIAYAKWEARARTVSAIGPVAIGEPMADVAFKLGKFEQAKVPGASKYPDERLYSHETLPISLNVSQGRVMYAIYHCRDKDRDLYGSFNGIRCGDDGNAVMKAFGDKVRVLCRKDPTLPHLRAYDVVHYGTRYIMSSNKVSSVGVADPAELASFVGLNWDKCGIAPLDMRSPEEAKKGEEPGAVPVKAAPSTAKTSGGN